MGPHLDLRPLHPGKFTFFFSDSFWWERPLLSLTRVQQAGSRAGPACPSAPNGGRLCLRLLLFATANSCGRQQSDCPQLPLSSDTRVHSLPWAAAFPNCTVVPTARVPSCWFASVLTAPSVGRQIVPQEALGSFLTPSLRGPRPALLTL